MLDILIVVGSLIGFVALTLGTALFVGAEFSLTALERSTIDNDVATRGDRRSQQVQRAHRTLSFQLSACQLGITITTLITGYIAEPVLARFLHPGFAAIGIPEGWVSPIVLIVALVIATSLSMVLGELIPKNMAIAKPMMVARATAGPLRMFAGTFRWAIDGLNRAANAIVRRFGIEPADELASARSPEELTALVRNSALHGALDEGTAALVSRSLIFGELSAEDLMTPRVTVHSLGADDTVRDLIESASRSGFSRFPVTVNGDLDDIVGVVHVKQAFTIAHDRRNTTTLREIARRVPVVPASLDGDSLMEQIRADGLQVALVVDEYGGTAGMCTTEDLIEEIVGDVTDEHDDELADVQAEGDGFSCAGLLRLDELTAATGYHAPDGPYDTLGGLIMFALGTIPHVGDKVILPTRTLGPDDVDSEAVNNDEMVWQATVTHMDGRRVDIASLQPVGTVGSRLGVVEE